MEDEEDCKENIALIKDLGVWDELEEINKKMRKFIPTDIEWINFIKKKIELLEYVQQFKKEHPKKEMID